MDHTFDDVRASDPVERLLEDSWEARSEQATRRELIVEGAGSALFLAVALPLALPALRSGHVHVGTALLLVALYAVVSRMIRFPLGAGYVVPSYLVLVPMLLLLPPLSVPLLAAAGLLLGTFVRWLTGRSSRQQLLFALPDAWHVLGPAAVLALAGGVHGTTEGFVYVAALLAGCVVDLMTSTLREVAAAGVAPRIQLRVIAIVWLIDACLAPLGLLLAYEGRDDPLLLVLILPLTVLLAVADRERTNRIEEAQRRLGVVARERARLQSAVSRLGDAFAAKLDLDALTNVVLHGSIDAVDASAGRLVLHPPGAARVTKSSGPPEFDHLLSRVSRLASAQRELFQCDCTDASALAIPFGLGQDDRGTLAIARHGRAFSEDEQTLIVGLVERAHIAAEEIIAHELLREQAQTDPLTSLGNRRKLTNDLGDRLANATDQPVVLMLFDLDGFKSYNDTFGHVAGDALLARLGRKLAQAVAGRGVAYRLGGDEFCVLLPVHDALDHDVAAAACSLEEHGETFAISASCGSVLVPHEATTSEYALQLADERMYRHKQARPSGAQEQAHDVLIHILRAKQNGLPGHSTDVVRLAVAVGRRLGMEAEQVDELSRAASLHDIGAVGIPDAILEKPGPLDADEWSFVSQHPVLGERILNAAPALRPIATIVRATRERWDGAGYPDGLSGTEIPLASRIIAVCVAYDAIITDRRYRPARTPAAARIELGEEAGSQFDPAVVSAFIAELDLLGSDRLDEHARTGPDHRQERHALLAAQVVERVRELLSD
jgi:diguanylate cyclase (GGDEF)-like protein